MGPQAFLHASPLLSTPPLPEFPKQSTISASPNVDAPKFIHQRSHLHMHEHPAPPPVPPRAKRKTIQNPSTGHTHRDRRLRLRITRTSTSTARTASSRSTPSRIPTRRGPFPLPSRAAGNRRPRLGNTRPDGPPPRHRGPLERRTPPSLGGTPPAAADAYLGVSRGSVPALRFARRGGRHGPVLVR